MLTHFSDSLFYADNEKDDCFFLLRFRSKDLINSGKKRTGRRIRTNILSADFFSDAAKPS